MQVMKVNGDDGDEGVKGDDDDAFGTEWIGSWVSLLVLVCQCHDQSKETNNKI